MGLPQEALGEGAPLPMRAWGKEVGPQAARKGAWGRGGPPAEDFREATNINKLNGISPYI